MYVLVYAFISAVVGISVGVGLWLQGQLEQSHQDIHVPSPMVRTAKAA